MSELVRVSFHNVYGSSLPEGGKEEEEKEEKRVKTREEEQRTN